MRNSPNHGYIGNKPNRETLYTSDDYLKDSPDVLATSVATNKLYEDVLHALDNAEIYTVIEGNQDLNDYFQTLEKKYFGSNDETILNLPDSFGIPFFMNGFYNSDKTRYTQIVWNKTGRIFIRVAEINWTNPANPVVTWNPWLTHASTIDVSDLGTTVEETKQDKLSGTTGSVVLYGEEDGEPESIGIDSVATTDSENLVKSKAVIAAIGKIDIKYDAETGVLTLIDKNASSVDPKTLGTVNLPLEQFLKSVSLEVDPTNELTGTFLKFTFQTDEGENIIYVNVSELEESLNITNLEEQIYLDMKTNPANNWEIFADNVQETTYYKLCDVEDIADPAIVPQCYLEMMISNNEQGTSNLGIKQNSVYLKLFFKRNTTITGQPPQINSYVIEGDYNEYLSNTRICIYTNSDDSLSIYAVARETTSVYTPTPNHYFSGKILGSNLTISEDPVGVASVPGTLYFDSYTHRNSAINIDYSSESPALTLASKITAVLDEKCVGTTQTAGTNNTTLATTEFVTTALSSVATSTSPDLSGTPTAPTAEAGTNTTQIATTAFVHTEITNAIAAIDEYEISMHFNLDLSTEPLRTSLLSGYTHAQVVYSATNATSATLAMSKTYSTGSVSLTNVKTDVTGYDGIGVTFTPTITGSGKLADFRIKFTKS
jgi:hypothetical protein